MARVDSIHLPRRGIDAESRSTTPPPPSLRPQSFLFSLDQSLVRNTVERHDRTCLILSLENDLTCLESLDQQRNRTVGRVQSWLSRNDTDGLLDLRCMAIQSPPPAIMLIRAYVDNRRLHV